MPDRIAELRDFVQTVDADLQRYFPFTVEKVAASGSPDDLPGTYFVNGLAAVYNKWSLDLGGFRERIRPGAFDEVLKEDPHVLHVWDHDTSKTLSSTRNGTLEIKSVKDGLHYHSKVAPTSYAKDLEILLRRRDIDQSSFAFTVGEDEWRIKEDDGEEIIERDVVRVNGLYDVTTCAMGAYPQTESALAVRSLASAKRRTSVVIPQFWSLDSTLSGTTAKTGYTFAAATTTPLPGTTQVSVVPPEAVAPVESEAGAEQTAPEPPVAERAAEEAIEELKRTTRGDLQSARNRYIRGKEDG